MTIDSILDNVIGRALYWARLHYLDVTEVNRNGTPQKTSDAERIRRAAMVEEYGQLLADIGFQTSAYTAKVYLFERLKGFTPIAGAPM